MDESRDQHAVLIDSPGYKGPERREVLIIGPCACHREHQRILQDHEDEIKELQNNREKQRDHAEKAHGAIYSEINTVDRSKVSNKLFYLYITVYSLFFIGGIVSVYTGMNKNALMFKDGLTEVKVMQSELKTTLKNTDSRIQDLKEEFKDIRAEFKDIRAEIKVLKRYRR